MKQPTTAAEADAYMKKAGEMQQSIAEGTAPPPKSSPIPEKYGNPETSELNYVIKENEANSFKIELKG